MTKTEIILLARSIQTASLDLSDFLAENGEDLNKEAYYGLHLTEEFCRRAVDLLKNENIPGAN